jgi:thioesterase domain-containing protein
VLEYRELVLHLSRSQPVYGFEAPGASAGKPVLRSIEQLAAAYIVELRQKQPKGPYYLCGYCWAGALTFEMAQQLRASGDDVALLALIDAMCPGHFGSSSRSARVSRHGRSLWRLFTHNLHRLGSLDARTLPAFLGERLLNLLTRAVGPMAYAWSVRLGRPLLPAFRGRRQAFLHAVKCYRPAPYPGRVTLFRAQTPGTNQIDDANWGWDRVASGGVELYPVAGEHLELLREPSVRQLATELQSCLDPARAASA